MGFPAYPPPPDPTAFSYILVPKDGYRVGVRPLLRGEGGQEREGLGRGEEDGGFVVVVVEDEIGGWEIV